MKKRRKNIYWVILSVLFVLTTICQINAQAKHKPKTQTARVLISEQGYSRTTIRLRRGVPARITFLRTTDATCATEVVIADFGIRRSLPLNQAVAVAFTPKKSGEIGFACGMNMMHGKLIVR